MNKMNPFAGKTEAPRLWNSYKEMLDYWNIPLPNQAKFLSRIFLKELNERREKLSTVHKQFAASRGNAQ